MYESGVYSTCSHNQYLGLTATDTVQERSGADIEVEESHDAAQLGQSEPHVDEVWLVAHQQGHCVALLQSPVVQEGLRYPVTPPVHILVGVHLPFIDEERLVGLLLSQLHKLVQDSDNPPSQPVHLHSQPIQQNFQQVSQVSPEVGEEEFLDEVQGDNSGGSARYPGGQHWEWIKVVPATHFLTARRLDTRSRDVVSSLAGCGVPGESRSGLRLFPPSPPPEKCAAALGSRTNSRSGTSSTGGGKQPAAAARRAPPPHCPAQSRHGRRPQRPARPPASAPPPPPARCGGPCTCGTARPGGRGQGRRGGSPSPHHARLTRESPGARDSRTAPSCWRAAAAAP